MQSNKEDDEEHKEDAKSQATKVVREQVLQLLGDLQSISEGFGPSDTFLRDEQLQKNNPKDI